VVKRENSQWTPKGAKVRKLDEATILSWSRLPAIMVCFEYDSSPLSGILRAEPILTFAGYWLDSES
jgi:hypothetical protein